ncbi:MAG: Crp/Fnr family transcriptional regulator [Pseudolabrys sp.]|nr:Crp/Fnr family transcriptional regulator [Pseudolabrys sp.]MBV9261466.1 Crp/Fnr family transcriptional regulator [Pseudolabrys sp.]
MPLDEDMALFEQVPLLAQLGEEAMRILAIGAETHPIQNGAVLYYAGDLADSGYLIQHGSFLLESDAQSKREDLRIGPGTLLAELALLTDTVHTETATALTAGAVTRIPRSLFLKVLEGYPAAARRLRDAMAHRVDATTRDIETLKARIDPDEI